MCVCVCVCVLCGLIDDEVHGCGVCGVMLMCDDVHYTDRVCVCVCLVKCSIFFLIEFVFSDE